MITVDVTLTFRQVTDVVMDGHAEHGEYGYTFMQASAVFR